MGISLSKGQTVSLAKNTGLAKVAMGLGWDAAKKKGMFGMFAAAADIDLDASVLVFDANGGVLDTVWFRQLRGMNGAIVHSGDNRTGDGDGDDETINIDLAALDAKAVSLVFVVNSFTGQTFNDVENASCRLVDLAKREELVKFTLAEKGANTGVVMALLSRKTGAWEMTAIGQPVNGRTVQDMTAAARRVI
jgi:tellurium resistance protein TerZ